MRHCLRTWLPSSAINSILVPPRSMPMRIESRTCVALDGGASVGTRAVVLAVDAASHARFGLSGTRVRAHQGLAFVAQRAIRQRHTQAVRPVAVFAAGVRAHATGPTHAGAADAGRDALGFAGGAGIRAFGLVLAARDDAHTQRSPQRCR